MKRIALLLALSMGANAHADFLSGNDLFDKMKGEGMAARMVALGYVIGVSDTTYNIAHCMPASVSGKQANDVVMRLLENNPSLRHYSAESIVVKALSETWPCPKKGTGT